MQERLTSLCRAECCLGCLGCLGCLPGAMTILGFIKARFSFSPRDRWPKTAFLIGTFCLLQMRPRGSTLDDDTCIIAIEGVDCSGPSACPAV